MNAKEAKTASDTVSEERKKGLRAELEVSIENSCQRGEYSASIVLHKTCELCVEDYTQRGFTVERTENYNGADLVKMTVSWE